MWLKRTTLVLLTVAALVVSGKDVIIQTQRRAEVPAGSSVTFLCPVTSLCHVRIGKLDGYRVNWLFNSTGPSSGGVRKLSNDISNNSAKSSTVVSNKTKQNIEKNKYTLINATTNDTGWYSCILIVEIPVLKHCESNGTELIITESKELTTYPSLPKLTGKQGLFVCMHECVYVHMYVCMYVCVHGCVYAGSNYSWFLNISWQFL